MSELRMVPGKPCRLCRKRVWLEEGQTFCSHCTGKIEKLYAYPCRKCGNPASDCECSGNKWLKFLFWYDCPTARTYINRLKNDPRDYEVEFLGTELAKKCTGRYDAVTFVPRDPAARKVHGSDHAELLAHAVAEALGLPVVATLECRGVIIQKFLSASQREKLVRGRFAVLDEALRDHRRLLLVDDVSTTGATLRGTSRLLREHGAEAVACAAMCKTQENYR